MNKLDKVILDADICFKLGRFTNNNFIEKIIPHIANEVYIHEYVYDRELLTPNTGKSQVKELVKSKNVVLLREGDLSELEKQVYESTVKLLCKVMKGQDFFYDKEHRGEIVSLAMAKTLRISIFMTDEKDLQPIIDSKLNSKVPEDIHVFRLIDLMYWIKENSVCEINRKEAKRIWCGAYDRSMIDFYKNKFDKEIWGI
jgi:hypothetical protein